MELPPDARGDDHSDDSQPEGKPMHIEPAGYWTGVNAPTIPRLAAPRLVGPDEMHPSHHQHGYGWYADNGHNCRSDPDWNIDALGQWSGAPQNDGGHDETAGEHHQPKKGAPGPGDVRVFLTEGR